jgi:protein-tyrosine-phosphatase
MAAGFLRKLAGGRVDVLSAGTEPADEVNPLVIRAMAEKDIDLARAEPRPLEDAAVKTADVVVTMGCGDACPIYPGKRYEDWSLEDPAGKGIDDVRRIRDDIEDRVRSLASELV